MQMLLFQLILLLQVNITPGHETGPDRNFQTIKISLPSKPGVITMHARQVLADQITQRCSARIVTGKQAELNITLAIKPANKPESFTIIKDVGAGITIIGNDENGLIYGIGKFLRSSRFDKGGFTPGDWTGSSAPTGKVRGMYFASHFGNFYEAAPIREVAAYVDELALWGINYLVLHFPQFQFNGFDDPAAQMILERIRQVMQVAKANGMKVGLIQVPNGSFKSTPKNLLNTPVPDDLHRRGDFGVNLDPAKPAALALLKKDWLTLLDQFKQPGLDAVVFWPYDEGGCGCSTCWPWGARGFPRLSEELAQIARKKYPAMQVVLSTWVFDTPVAGEWKGLSEYLQKDNNWLNYIMADSHEGFPRFPLDNGVPGALPMLNFPEISMWGQDPWGGYGANPLANRLQRLWNETGNKLSGGFPYSEGIYEDINKVICSQLYWNGQQSTQAILREYIGYEFSPVVADSVAKAITILESNHDREHIQPTAGDAFRLIEGAAQKLRPQVLNSWRWRILYLRALIDREMLVTNGRLEGETLKKAFNELTAIYHAENGHSMPIHPPVIQ